MSDDLVPLRDILSEIEFLKSIRDRSSFETFRTSPVDVRAASYSVMIISEAVRRIPREWLDEHPTTPWRAIRGIGNKLRHEYQHVSETILWDVIDQHVVDLRSTIEAMLSAHGPPSGGT